MESKIDIQIIPSLEETTAAHQQKRMSSTIHPVIVGFSSLHSTYEENTKERMNSDSDCDSISEISNTPSFGLDQMTDEDIVELTNDIYCLFDEYFQKNILLMSSPKFYTQLCQEIANVIFDEWISANLISQLENTETDEEENHYVYEELLEYIEELLETYHLFSNVPKRSISPLYQRRFDTAPQPADCFNNSADLHVENPKDNSPELLKQVEHLQITKRIEELRATPQPKQRTPEWYAFRNGLLSASNLWKVFGSEAQINSIIYEKCRPMNEHSNYGHTNLESSLHWGVKYEPLAIMIYENMFSAKIEEFGCIQHSKYSFLGASPDGIVTEPTSSRYGRMLEIKNIVNRDITGIPKEEYWIQTQIQMETCNLNECDFLETRFLEYNDAATFYTDREHEYKGVILHFIPIQSFENSAPIYKYMPIEVICDLETVEKWVQQCKNECREQGLVLLNTLYWYLEEFSCVLIERNRHWFAAAIPRIQEIWDIILKERETGYEHRASKNARARAGSGSFGGGCAAATDDKIVVSTNIINTSRSIRNMPFGNSICLIKLEDTI